MERFVKPAAAVAALAGLVLVAAGVAAGASQAVCAGVVLVGMGASLALLETVKVEVGGMKGG